jgi:hypothetical protein
MSDVLFPPSLAVARSRIRYLDATGVSRSPYGGVTRTAALLGDRLGLSIEATIQGGTSAASAQYRSALMAFINALQGQLGRAYFWDHSYTKRGSFSCPELLTNNDFSNGTTGWTPTNVTLTAQDGVLRATKTIGGTGTDAVQTATVAINIPYVVRVAFKTPSNLASVLNAYSTGGIAAVFNALAAGQGGVASVAVVPTGTSLTCDAYDSSSGGTAGNYWEAVWASIARCALADNAPNLLLQSQTFDVTWTTGGGSTSLIANQGTAPDGTVTGDYIRETSTLNVEHYMQQAVTVSSAVQDFTFVCSVASVTRGWAVVRLFENTGNTEVRVWVNLATGALGTSATGANWANIRTSVVSQGSGWYRVSVTGRKTNAATALTAIISSATADASLSYAGTVSQNAIVLWGASLAASSFSVAYTVTTTVASTGTAQTGNTINLKGLPVSTNGLLLAGDQVEVVTSRGSELKIVTAPLNSDASGLGLLQFSPRLRGVPADNAAVIINRPMGKFVYSGNNIEWSNDPGVFSAAAFDFEEAT